MDIEISEISNMFFDTRKVPVYVDLFVHGALNGIELHSHSFYEFVYIAQGFSSHCYNKVTSVLTPGDMFAIRPNDLHGYASPKQTKLYNCLFYPEALGDKFEEILKLPGLEWLFNKERPSVWQRVHFDPAGQKEITVCLEKMRQECRNMETGWEIKTKSLLSGLLVDFARVFEKQHRGGEKGGQQYTKYVYYAISYIEKNFDKNIYIKEIADTIGLNSDYLSRIFKILVGMSPMEYLKNVRLAKAAELLQNPLLSVSRVAEKAGFDDPAYFTRQFKHLLGISPSRYQNTFK